MSMITGRRKAAAWQRTHEPGTPDVGEAAPDFELRDVLGENPTRLAHFRGVRPVALIFGSFT